MSANQNYYELLGVDRSAGKNEIRRAFWKLSKALHPDTTILQIEDAKIKFQKVCEAFENLSDPESREAYDAKLDSHKEIDNKITLDRNSLELNFRVKKSQIGYRRPLSGGELFSLFFLVSVIAICLLLAIILSFKTGKSFNTIPSWLILPLI